MEEERQDLVGFPLTRVSKESTSSCCCCCCCSMVACTVTQHEGWSASQEVNEVSAQIPAFSSAMSSNVAASGALDFRVFENDGPKS